MLDGHSSHISFDVIEIARDNNIHLLCLPAHTTHLLQPLDVAVFKSLKSHYNKFCHEFSAKGRVVTPDDITPLFAKAWSNALTPVNIMNGFRKSGIYPLNPGQTDDRQCAPCMATSHCRKSPSIGSSEHSHSGSEASSVSLRTHADRGTSSVDSESILDEVLSLPMPPKKTKSRSKTSKAQCITEEDFLQELKDEEKERQEKEEQKKAKKLEREKRKLERDQLKETKRLEREQKRKEREAD